MATLEEQNLPTPTLTSTNPGAVYSPTNIQQIDIPSQKKASDMKLADLENKLSKANSMAELNQISIMNQPKAMGVLTGEAAYRSKLDTARLNAFNSLYNNRLVEQQRKDAERAQFMQTYGADPSKRPKGMSKKEFAKALGSGKFQNLLTPEFRQAQEMNALDIAAKKKSLAGGSSTAPGASPELAAVASAFDQFGGDWGQTANYLASKGFDVSSGSVIDNELRRRNGLPPIVQQTATERAVEQKQAQADQEAVDMAKAAIPDLEKKIKLLDEVTGRGVGAGLGGFIERNIPSLLGAKPDNIGRIKSIIGQETLQTLLNLKAKGGTLGAISEKELSILQSSASRIGAAEISDSKGNVIGYRMTEGEFEKEIKSMKEATQRVLEEAQRKAGVGASQGTRVIAPDGQEIIITN